MSGTILVEKKDGVATVAMNRPDRMSSLTDELLTTLVERLREVQDDSDVRVVVLTGSGDRAFSAGAGLARPGAPGPADRNATRRTCPASRSTRSRGASPRAPRSRR